MEKIVRHTYFACPYLAVSSKMSAGGENVKKKKIIVIVILLLLLFAGVFIFQKCNSGGDTQNPISFLIPDKNAEEWNGNQELPQSGNNEEAYIPGFKSLVFIAGQTNQKVNFYNPEENTCLFRMTLYVEGEELWQSGFIEPGKCFYEIECLKALEPGAYGGILMVECFLEDGTACNTANVEFDLTAVEEK